jgi:hypothetical protein
MKNKSIRIIGPYISKKEGILSKNYYSDLKLFSDIQSQLFITNLPKL